MSRWSSRPSKGSASIGLLCALAAACVGLAVSALMSAAPPKPDAPAHVRVAAAAALRIQDPPPQQPQAEIQRGTLQLARGEASREIQINQVDLAKARVAYGVYCKRQPGGPPARARVRCEVLPDGTAVRIHRLPGCSGDPVQVYWRVVEED